MYWSSYRAPGLGIVESWLDRFAGQSLSAQAYPLERDPDERGACVPAGAAEERSATVVALPVNGAARDARSCFTVSPELAGAGAAERVEAMDECSARRPGFERWRMPW